mmetsp:Transcript_22130/g.44969  ORF Transcript_22130/g.44969 Transcript_22130/m.44969 type:complete len:119 (-) Transcript_22130:181-537(-)
MSTPLIAGEPAFGMIISTVGRVVFGSGGEFGFEIDGIHDLGVSAVLLGGEFGARAEEEEEEEGGEAVEVGGGEEFVAGGEGAEGAEGEGGWGGGVGGEGGVGGLGLAIVVHGRDGGKL